MLDFSCPSETPNECCILEPIIENRSILAYNKPLSGRRTLIFDMNGIIWGAILIFLSLILALLHKYLKPLRGKDRQLKALIDKTLYDKAFRRKAESLCNNAPYFTWLCFYWFKE